MFREELFRGYSDEQIKRAKACRTTDELLELARAEGVQLTEDQLGAISGGGCSTDDDNNKEKNKRKVDS